MFWVLRVASVVLLVLASGQLQAQDWSFGGELELGAVFTDGNTEDENVRFKSRFDAERAAWAYRVTIDGFRSSKQDQLAAQRIYTVGSATYSFDPDNFVMSRAAHEDDRFSGYDSQSDVSVSYGQVLLRARENMTLRYTIGAGMRMSRGALNGADDFDEAIMRLSTDYSWSISENSRFLQSLSVDAGERSNISRSESAIEADILSNLAMKFAVKIRHQTEVPMGRKKTDTEAAITLLVRI
jgi:putative salt-induced outer membrane protein